MLNFFASCFTRSLQFIVVAYWNVHEIAHTPREMSSRKNLFPEAILKRDVKGEDFNGTSVHKNRYINPIIKHFH